MAKRASSVLKYARSKSSAFTLVELIVVITILAVLATVGFLALQGYTKDAKDSAAKANVRTVSSAVDIPEKLVTGKTRNRTFFQVAALAGTTAYVEGTFSVALAQSGSGTSTETTVTGLIADPNA